MYPLCFALSISACFRIHLHPSASIPRSLFHHSPDFSVAPNHLFSPGPNPASSRPPPPCRPSLPGSKSSGSNRSNSENSRRREKDRKSAGGGGSSSGSDPATWSGGGGSVLRHERPPSQLSHRSHVSATLSERSPRSHHSYGPPGGLPSLGNFPKLGGKVYATSGPPGGPPVRELGSVPPELTGSRQSFQKAMGNPCEFFVDIM